MRPNRWNSEWAVFYSLAVALLPANFSLHAATVADWTFEEGVPGQAVTQVQDASGNGHTGSIVWGSPTFVQSGAGSQGNVSISLPAGSGFSPQDSPAFNRRPTGLTSLAFVDTVLPQLTKQEEA
ncbi:MAG: hypothetical protein ACYDH9_01165 [Limisphaerales bacterium]